MRSEIRKLTSEIKEKEEYILQKRTKTEEYADKIAKYSVILDETSRNKIIRTYERLISETEEEIENAKKELTNLKQELVSISKGKVIKSNTETEDTVSRRHNRVKSISLYALSVASLLLLYIIGKNVYIQNEKLESELRGLQLESNELETAENSVVSQNGEQELVFEDQPTTLNEEKEEIIARVVKEFPEAKEVIKRSGMLLDATNDAQVESRAQAMYDIYFAKSLETIREITKDWKEEDKPVYLTMFTPEELANYIRWRNNVLPKVNGKSVYAVDGSTHDKYITFAAQMGNMTSDGRFFNKPLFIPTCLMSIDGSKDQNLSLLWNKNYNDITNAMNGDSNLGSEYILTTLGEHLRDRALFAGRDGKLTFWDLNDENSNPYAVVQDALNPFERVVQWYLSPNDRKNAAEVVCLETCINYETGEPEIWSLTRIYAAVIDVKENEIIHQMAGVDFTGRTIEQTFYEAQHDKFMQQAEALGSSYTYRG